MNLTSDLFTLHVEVFCWLTVLTKALQGQDSVPLSVNLEMLISGLLGALRMVGHSDAAL